MKPSGAPMTKNRTHARRRARARFGRLRLGPRGSFQSGRGRFRELAIGSLSTGCVPIKATAIISRKIIATGFPEQPGARPPPYAGRRARSGKAQGPAVRYSSNATSDNVGGVRARVSVIVLLVVAVLSAILGIVLLAASTVPQTKTTHFDIP